MVLAEHLVEVHARGALVAAQVLHRGGAGGGGHLLAVELVDVGDARVGLHRHANLFHEGGHREGHVLLTIGIVGGGAALDVHGAVLHQGLAVLGGDDLVLDVELGHAQGLLDVGQGALADLHVEAGKLAVAQGEAQGARGLAHAHGDAAGILDLLEGVGLGQARGSSQGRHQDERLLHECSCGGWEGCGGLPHVTDSRE